MTPYHSPVLRFQVENRRNSLQAGTIQREETTASPRALSPEW